MYMYTLKFLRKINFIYFCILQYLDDLATVSKDKVHLNAPYKGRVSHTHLTTPTNTNIN